MFASAWSLRGTPDYLAEESLPDGRRWLAGYAQQVGMTKSSQPVIAQTVHPVIADRIRRPMPTGLSVLPNSLPVVSFGDPNLATVATLSLNPSWIEFQSKSGAWLRGVDRRLASLISLGADDPKELDDQQVAQAVAESNAYFRGGNWYKAWFHWLESLVAGSGAGSYLDGSACHLDLVQWATKPAQGKLPSAVWSRLVDDDHDFLRWQLAASNVSVVLMNGAATVTWVENAGLLSGIEFDDVGYARKYGVGTLRMSRGVAEGVLFLGWNKPLAGAISSDGRTQLATWVSQRLLERESATISDGVVGGSATRPDLAQGFVPVGTRVGGLAELEVLLSRWYRQSQEATVGDVGAFGGSPVIIVSTPSDEFVLNRDTKRAAVEAFLAAAKEAGGAANLSWHVAVNNRGTINRVSYLRDDSATPGWYAYLRKPATERRELR
jgi:hypothetical protein